MKVVAQRIVVYRCRRALLGWMGVAVFGLVGTTVLFITYGLEWRRQARDWRQAAAEANAGWRRTEDALAGCQATSATAAHAFAASAHRWQGVFRYCQAFPHAAACRALDAP